MEVRQHLLSVEHLDAAVELLGKLGLLKNQVLSADLLNGHQCDQVGVDERRDQISKEVEEHKGALSVCNRHRFLLSIESDVAL